MIVKTSDLTEAALRWVVAKCEGVEFTDEEQPYAHELMHFNYPTDWSMGGPIIEREKIELEFFPGAGDAGADVWVATRVKNPAFAEEQGPTPLVAAMRCYVASQLGDEVDVPNELINRD